MSKGKSGLFKYAVMSTRPVVNTGGGSFDNEIRAPDTGVITDAASEAGYLPEVHEITLNGGPPKTPDVGGSTDSGESPSYLPNEMMESGACNHAVIGKIFADRDLSVKDAEEHKDMLMNMTAKDYENVLSDHGFVLHGIKQSSRGSGSGWKVVINTCDNPGAKLNGVFVHHAVASHGAPYIKFSTTHGKIKIVDNRNATYDDRDEKNTIVIFLKDL